MGGARWAVLLLGDTGELGGGADATGVLHTGILLVGTPSVSSLPDAPPFVKGWASIVLPEGLSGGTTSTATTR